MNKTLRRNFGALSSALLLAISQAAVAQLSVTANGPYYATPSWSQKLTKNRFVVLADWDHEAVLDRETGLVWHRSPVDLPGRSWSGGHFACQSIRIGGRAGWRLPAVHELSSLSAPQPSDFNLYQLPDGHPFDFDDDPSSTSFYWTATRDATVPDGRAVLISFDFGSMFAGSMATAHRVWCVRGASSGNGGL